MELHVERLTGAGPPPKRLIDALQARIGTATIPSSASASSSSSGSTHPARTVRQPPPQWEAALAAAGMVQSTQSVALVAGDFVGTAPAASHKAAARADDYSRERREAARCVSPAIDAATSSVSGSRSAEHIAPQTRCRSPAGKAFADGQCMDRTLETMSPATTRRAADVPTPARAAAIRAGNATIAAVAAAAKVAAASAASRSANGFQSMPQVGLAAATAAPATAQTRRSPAPSRRAASPAPPRRAALASAASGAAGKPEAVFAASRAGQRGAAPTETRSRSRSRSRSFGRLPQGSRSTARQRMDPQAALGAAAQMDAGTARLQHENEALRMRLAETTERLARLEAAGAAAATAAALESARLREDNEVLRLRLADSAQRMAALEPLPQRLGDATDRIATLEGAVVQLRARAERAEAAEAAAAAAGAAAALGGMAGPPTPATLMAQASVASPLSGRRVGAKAKASRPPVPDFQPRGSPRHATQPVGDLAPEPPAVRLRRIELPPADPEDNYEISEPGDLEDEEALMLSQDRDRTHKHVPSWCASYLEDLAAQVTVDPDSIFGSRVPSCDLTSVFPDSLYATVGQNVPKRRRGSSGDWGQDKLTRMEVIAYKRVMGHRDTWDRCGPACAMGSVRADSTKATSRKQTSADCAQPLRAIAPFAQQQLVMATVN
eukprot:TRINITY_DN14152_c0_g1_i1.p1 TRINITY_DN14152_c0_g1~~TRINITY_DN14152_c0_g1_i1.p1  ORF type:complete len:669 (+),score=125.95 TRINITY_DN14152_c0_g1_i1:85-2091(+)